MKREIPQANFDAYDSDEDYENEVSGWLIDIALWLSAIIALVVLGAHILVSFFGFGFYSFSTTSMEPTISAGSISITKEIDNANSIEVGDILTVHYPDRERPMTHRVTQINNEDSIDRALVNHTEYYDVSGDNGFLYNLTGGFLGESERTVEQRVATRDKVENNEIVVVNMQGDANEHEDDFSYVIGNSNADKYIFHIPFAGSILGFFSSYFFWILGITAIIVVGFILYPRIRNFQR